MRNRGYCEHGVQLKLACATCRIPPGKPYAPTFETAAEKTLDVVRDTYKQRGGEYADSWHLDNQVTTFLDATLSAFGKNLTSNEKRLILLASLVDVKDQRMIGEFKMDTVVDGIAYRAAWAALMEDYKNEHSG